jgi:hypothetical protein
MRGWREVAPAGASVFWKKFRILLFPFAEDDFVADAGPLDGVDAFLANDPAIARGGIKAKAGRLRDSGSGFDGSPNDGVGLSWRRYRQVTLLEYVQNGVHYSHESRDCCCAPPDASEDEPRGRRNTKSREHYLVKWDIYSVQSYRCNNGKRKVQSLKMDLIDCKCIGHTRNKQNNASRDWGRPPRISLLATPPRPLRFKACLFKRHSITVEMCQVIDETPSLHVETLLCIPTIALAFCTFQAARFAPRIRSFRGNIIT